MTGQTTYGEEFVFRLLRSRIIRGFPKDSRLGEFSRSRMQLDQVTASQLDQFAHRMAYELTTSVLATHLVSRQAGWEVEHPATWWQHLKADIPLWMKLCIPLSAWRRHPVRMKKTVIQAEFNAWDTYPRADIIAPETGPPVLFESFTVAHQESPWRVTYRDPGVPKDQKFATEKELQQFLEEWLNVAAIRYDPLGRYTSLPHREALREIMKALTALQVNTSEIARYRQVERATMEL